MLVINVTKLLLGILILSSLWSLMHAFTGGSSGELQALHSLQFSGVLFSSLIILFSLAMVSRGRGLRAGMKIIWAHVPTWLVFGSLVVVSLAVIGKLSYYLLRDAVWIPEDWFNHSALLCLSLTSIAFVLVSGTGHFFAGGAPYSKERW